MHLVNGVGSRPLKNTVECHHLEFAVRGWKEGKVSRIFPHWRARLFPGRKVTAGSGYDWKAFLFGI